MMLSVGNKIVYPYQGPCLIDALVKKVVGAKPTSFYIPKLLRRLKKPAATAMNWKQRAIDNLKLLASGSPSDLADVVESLTELNEARTLSPVA
jgi:RNA polymerase-interacting CarD/CdnL/TRCF family regulator